MDEGVYRLDGTSMKCEECKGTGEIEYSCILNDRHFHYKTCQDCDGTGLVEDEPEEVVVLTADKVGHSLEAMAEELDKVWEVVNLLYEIHQGELIQQKAYFGYRSPEAAE